MFHPRAIPTALVLVLAFAVTLFWCRWAAADERADRIATGVHDLDQGRPGRARRTFTRLLNDLGPDDEVRRLLDLAAQLALAASRLESGRVPQALSLLETLRGTHDDAVGLHVLLARTYRVVGRTRDAEREQRRAAELSTARDPR